MATKAGDCVEVERLVSGGAVVNYYDEEFECATPMHIAAAYGCDDMANMLLRLGARVNAT
eukprot:CAMPEP_0206272194 /NCGR_PEP_ID=MMETSP0047_2-20121206/33870_1 /ASSEMBLY_ACC=CAM_ASM_000192 /TAXON_ID=195065 /ORGANISM="Chroomonas mesostigmatica_cf, Strain CCMP1168" /LENGTH=59 /DNA_ID=CAMNT_0053701083 /DNA_START=39 /DNA_END=214 /DNA_ORIENTATION=+